MENIQINMENIFKFSQTEFIKSQIQTEVYIMDYVFSCVLITYNKLNDIKCDFIFLVRHMHFPQDTEECYLHMKAEPLKAHI